jgi:hypothetical protein
MSPENYALQLMQLRQFERNRSIDLQDRLNVVYSLRLDTIIKTTIPGQLRDRSIAAANRQYHAFVQRDPPANG